jgi:hypothetical protein
MNLAEKICEKARDLPEPLAKKVLEFMDQIMSSQSAGFEEMKKAQGSVMDRIWKNEVDDVWNDL